MTAPTYFNTAARIIPEALREARVIGTGQDPSSELYATCFNRLNDMINQWQTQGLKLWLNTDLSVTLTAGTATYTFGSGGTVSMTKPLRVIDAYYSDSNGVRRPLTMLARAEYDRLSQLTVQGQLNSYFVDKQQTLLSVSFWQTPDSTAAAGTAHLVIQQQVTNAISLTETMNFPQEWMLALLWGLAAEKCTGQPAAIVDRCQSRANSCFEALNDWDVEDASTSFAPDSQVGYGGGSRFR